MLYTSFYLAEKAGASIECTGFKVLKSSVKVQATEGISLLTVMDYAGFQDALWCLRAVHEEQFTAARKVAGILAIRAAQMAMSGMDDSFLRDALLMASDRVNSMVLPGSVIQFRKDVWTHITFMEEPLKWAGWLVWISLADDIIRRAVEIPECLDKALEQSTQLRRASGRASLESTFRNKVAGTLHGCAGPGVYDPEMKAPLATRKRTGIGYIRTYTPRNNGSGTRTRGKTSGE